MPADDPAGPLLERHPAPEVLVGGRPVTQQAITKCCVS
jgi:hypothetical protein